MVSDREAKTAAHAVLAGVLQVREGRLQVLLWQRAREPFAGAWALPGGTLEEDETLEESIRRHLAAKVDVRELSHVEQLETRSDPARNPRNHPPGGPSPPRPPRPDGEAARAGPGRRPARRALPLPHPHARDHRSVRRAPTAYDLSPVRSCWRDRRVSGEVKGDSAKRFADPLRMPPTIREVARD